MATRRKPRSKRDHQVRHPFVSVDVGTLTLLERSSEAIRCAGCSGQGRCLCTTEAQLLEEAADLIERAQRGSASVAELEAWTSRDQQRRAEKAELQRAYTSLSRQGGWRAVAAVRVLLGQDYFNASGSDEEVHLALREEGLRVRRELVGVAREWVAQHWLRPASRRSPRAVRP
jgi:hypothetical protein